MGSVTHSAGSSATTRSTVDVTTDGETGKKTRTLKFTGPVGDPGDEDYSTGDKLYVWRELAGDVTKHLAGELTMKDGSPTDGGTQASFEGELTVYDGTGAATSYDFGATNPLAGSTATLLHAGMTLNTDYSIDGATKAVTFADATGVAATVEALMTKGLVVSGLYDAENDRFPLAAGQPILSCTIAGLDGSTAHQFTLKKDGTEVQSVEWTTDEAGTASFAFVSSTMGSAAWTLDVTKGGSTVGSIDLGSRALGATVYNVSRLWTSSGFVKTRVVNLSEKTDGYEAENGDILTGTMPSNKELSIADGATVILRDATVNSSNNNGITCADATIILSGENTVSGKNSGIYIAPGTLTIQGSGSLTATATDTNTNALTGIGGYNNNCNLVIKGGTIVAQGGTASNSNYSGAGIGSRVNGQFGTITITGGDVTATGGANAAGIGCGSQGTCGDITISGGTVRATGGSTSGSGIGGTGNNGRCGNITISGGTVTATTNSYETPAIGNCTTNNGTCVTITSGITSVAMTSNSEYGTWNKVWYFLQDQTISIDGVNIPNYGNAVIENHYGTVGSEFNAGTKTWTLTKK